MKTKLIIGLVVDDGLDRLDGVQKFTVTIGEYFKEKGHEVHYLVGETNRNDIKNVHSLAKNIKVISNGGNQLSIPLPASGKKIDEVLNQVDFDVLHIQAPYSPFLAGKILSRVDTNKVSVFGTFHILPYGIFIRVGAYLMGLIQKNTLKKFDKFYSVSEPARSFARQAYGINSTVLANPVDISSFKTNNKKREDGTVRLVYLNRLVKRKGCLELLKAIKYIEDNGLAENDFSLDIVSDGALRNKLENFVVDNNLIEKVAFHGYVDDEQKASILGLADVAVFPSISGESFGIVLIEAMATGSCVVVGGDNPGYRSVLEDDATLFDPLDTASFASMLAGFINDQKYREKLIKFQQNEISKYDIKNIGQELLKDYILVAKSKGRSHNKE